jgi:hypothetical protein
VQLAGSTPFHWSTSGVFVAGFVVGAAFLIGVYLLLAGTRHGIRVSSRTGQLRREIGQHEQRESDLCALSANPAIRDQ